MRKRFLASIIFTVIMGMCFFSTTVNGAGITDFYTPINQENNKPINTSTIWMVNDTNFQSILNKHIFQKGDKIIFNSVLRESGSESSPNSKFEGFQIINGNGGPDVTSTLATINKLSEFAPSIAQEVTIKSEKPIILHSSAAGALGTVNNITHSAFYIRHGIYEQTYPIEYKNEDKAFLQYGGPQIDKAYITDDYYVIKFYDTYAKEGYHFKNIGIYSQTGQDFESVWLDPNTNPSKDGVTTLKTRIKIKSSTDGAIPEGKMIVDISMETGYTLKLDANGGKIDYIDSKIFEIKNKYTDIILSNYNIPIRDGYTFAGWYTDSACTTPALANTNFLNEVDASRIAEDARNITYYAKWIPSVSANTYTVSINSAAGFTSDLNSPKTVNKNDNLEITITAKNGYKLKSVKIDNVEQALPLTNNKLVLTDITKDINITVVAEKIIYNFDDNSKRLTYTAGTDEELSLRVEDATLDNFDKVYINNRLLDSKYYTVESGSIIVKIKDSYLKTLSSGTYSIRVLTNDGGEAKTTFVIKNKLNKKQTNTTDIIKTTKESNPNTGDQIMISLLLGSISLIGLLGTGYYIKKKKYN